MAMYLGNIPLGKGARGKSAYDYACEGGYRGTEEDYKIGLSKAADLYDLVMELKGMINGYTIGHEEVNGDLVMTLTFDVGT